MMVAIIIAFAVIVLIEVIIWISAVKRRRDYINKYFRRF